MRLELKSCFQMPRRHFATFTSFRREPAPRGTSQNLAERYLSVTAVAVGPRAQITASSSRVYTAHGTELSSLFEEAASSLERHWKLQHSATNQALWSRGLWGGGLLVRRGSLILLVERRWRLCREMRGVTAVARRRPDTRRGRGEVTSCSSGVIKVLFHMWHLRDVLLPTPRTFPCFTVLHSRMDPGARGHRESSVTVL